MQVADKPTPSVESDATMWAGARQPPAIRHLDVVLKPLSRPELGDIRIDAAVFVIGRTEQPFESYGNDVLNMLSRRHASIFRKEGFVYLVDLQSRNGTTVNRSGIGQEPCQLRDGDEICFGGSLSYRIQITPRLRPEGSLTVTLTPESGEAGLETLVLSKFPFLVSKTDGVLAHYKNDAAHGAELRYLSRRHAHIYQKGDQAYIGDLGSANGTFVDGVRLQEQAVPLQDGALIAFGGKHFVYRVRVVCESGVEPVVSETVHHMTERRLPIKALDKKEPPKSTAGTPPAAKNESPPPVAASPAPGSTLRASVSAKADSKAAVSASATPQPAAKPKGLGLFRFGSKHSKVNGPADGKSQPGEVGLQVKVKAAVEVGSQAAANPAAAVSQQAKDKPTRAASQPPEGKPQASSKPAAAAGPQTNTKAAVAASPQTNAKPAAAASPQTNAKPVAAASPQTNAKSAAEPTPPADSKPQNAGDLNLLAMDSGTQFMAAPTSFLTVLCAADQPKKEAAPDPAAAAVKETPVKRKPRGRVLLLLSELLTLIKGEPDGTSKKRWRYVAAAASVLIALIATAYIWNASERALREAIARNDYTRAAQIATRLLDKHPDDMELKAKATDLGLKAVVTPWLQKIKARDFEGAKVVLTSTLDLSKRDDDLRPLIDELDWLGGLERLISVRGGSEAPIRIYADEDGIEHIINRWNEDTGEHQRALSRIASHVPQFSDWYGEALTHLRRLQSDSTVYLAVIQRVKTSITTELARDNPEVLKPALKEIAQQYPRLGGMDTVRQDLASYIEIRREARSRKSGRLFALLEKAHFVTPPFQQSFHALMEGGQLPPADLLQQYGAATRSWKEHDPANALIELQKLATGPWAEDINREVARRRAVSTGFAALQQSRNASDYVDKLLAFRESLDADEDVYFIRATAADLSQQKSQVITRAQEAMTQARTFWQEYRSSGAIDASLRIETSISDDFRARAHSLAEASKYARQSFLLFSQVDPNEGAQWTAIRDEIETEIHEQRSRLRDLSNVVEPALLNTKLALLGDANE